MRGKLWLSALLHSTYDWDNRWGIGVQRSLHWLAAPRAKIGIHCQQLKRQSSYWLLLTREILLSKDRLGTVTGNQMISPVRHLYTETSLFPVNQWRFTIKICKICNICDHWSYLIYDRAASQVQQEGSARYNWLYTAILNRRAGRDILSISPELHSSRDYQHLPWLFLLEYSYRNYSCSCNLINTDSFLRPSIRRSL